MEKEKEKQRRKLKRTMIPLIAAAGMVVIALLVLVFAYLLPKYSYGTTYADLNEIYGVSGDEVVVYVNLQKIIPQGIVRDGTIYLDLDTVQDHLDSRYYLGSEGEIRYVLPDEVVEVPAGAASFEMQGETVTLGHSAFLTEQGVTYLAIDFISRFTLLTWESYEAPARLYITTDFSGQYQTANVKTASQIRVLAGIKSDILTDAPKGEKVRVIGETDDWSYVCYNGCIGYIQTKKLSALTNETAAAPREDWNYTGISKDETVVLVWQQIGLVDDNNDLGILLNGTEGVNVVSPTWFALSDNQGNFTSMAMSSYVEKAHGMGLDVWILADDFSVDVDLYQVLSADAYRENLIAKLIRATLEVEADGINIDFEYVSEATGEHFVEFIRELSVACHKNGLILSVDNYVPAGGREWLDRKEQGVMADYLIMMSYDEHYAGSSTAGSVASYSFSENGIADTIAEGVPAEKIINGIPLYTRRWTEIPESLAGVNDTIYADSGAVYPRYALSSYSVSMTEAASELEEQNVTLTWLEDERQYYGQFEEDGGTVRIWLEDTRSIGEKLGLIVKYKAAGAAFWRLGLEDRAVWETVKEVLELK